MSGTSHPTAPMLPAAAPARLTEARQAVLRLVGLLGPALGNIFLIPHSWIGLLLWAAVGWNIRNALFGLLGLVVALVSSKLLGIAEEPGVGGGLKANALLAAIAAAWVTEYTIYPLQTQAAIAVFAAVGAFNVTATIMRAMKRAEFPSMLWGYCIVAGVMFTIFPIGTKLSVQANQWWLAPPVGSAAWVTAFFQSLGSLLFAPTVGAGVVVACAIVLWSRTAFTMGLIGWASGVLVAVGVQGLGVPFYWLPASYNFFVVGMALGAHFFVPSFFSPLLAVVAGASASIIALGLQYLMPEMAYLPVSSALTIWIGIGTLALAGNGSGFLRNESARLTPEESWWRTAYRSRRLGRGEPLLVVPVPGVLEVTQSFDGALSHVGSNRYALDFQRPAVPGATVSSSIWAQPVVAPASGVVVRVHDGIADNAIGVCNYADSMGNFVCIQLDQGGWAVLGHLSQSTIAVSVGTRVQIGTYIGLVGNSGRSPVPHLHLQVQDSPDIGARTIPFRLANFLSGTNPGEPLREWNAAAVPARGTLVSASLPSLPTYSTLASLSPGAAIWSIDRHGTVPLMFRERRALSSIRIVRHLDERGQHLFRSQDGSKLVLDFDPDAWRLVEQTGTSPFLRLLALGTSSIPYAASAGLTWSDSVPVALLGASRWLGFPLVPYRCRPFIHADTTCIAAPNAQSSELTIETTLRPPHRSLPQKIVCKLDLLRGPVSLEAKFASGSVVYTVVSFQPGLPFEGAKRR